MYVAPVVPQGDVLLANADCMLPGPQVFCCLQGSVSVTVHRTRFAIGP